jgi:probable HAF family extracellular repeat protein
VNGKKEMVASMSMSSMGDDDYEVALASEQLPPGLNSRAFAVSGRGQVAGLAETCPNCGPHGFQAFLWTPTRPNATSGSKIGLGALPGQQRSSAQGVNDAGRVVGVSLYPTDSRAFIYDGRMHDLGTLPGGFSSQASAINRAGAVVGESSTAQGYGHAFLWVPDKREGTQGTMYDLGTPKGQAVSSATAINNRGVVAGTSLNAEFLGGRALIWRPFRPNGTRGTMTKLPQPAGVTDSDALAINDHGQIAGDLTTAAGQVHAFLFTTTMRDLGTLPGGTRSFAYGVNSHGVVVGFSERIPGGGEHAAMWNHGKITDLNRFLPSAAKAAGVVLVFAYAFNDKGQIVGLADVGGQAHAFLLTPARARH